MKLGIGKFLDVVFVTEDHQVYISESNDTWSTTEIIYRRLFTIRKIAIRNCFVIEVTVFKGCLTPTSPTHC